MDNVETFYYEIIKEKSKRLEKFERTASNFFNDIGFFSKIQRQYENELEKFTSYKFNTFKYIRVNENLISEIIVDILRPYGQHGQGSVFLEEFLKIIKIPNINKYPNIETEVLTRQHINSLRRMDILIDWNDFGIMIENKPRYDDKKDQLKDYAEDLKVKFNNKFAIVYLSNDHFPSEISISKEFREKLEKNNQYIHITYNNEFKKWIEICINLCQSEKYKWFLKDFLEYILNNYL